MRYLLILLLISPSVYSWVSVGSSPGFGTCDYLTIQDAIDDNESEIRLVNQTFTENLVINKSVEIIGSYGSCLATLINDLGLTTTNTVIKGSGNPDSATIDINPTILTNYSVKLRNLTIRDATNTSNSINGHGIDTGDSELILLIDNSLIINNTAKDGAGIYVGNSPDATITLINSAIFGNTASNRGGGLFCANSNTRINIIDNSLISENTAVNGGGIYAFNGCSVLIDSGVDTNNSPDSRGIIGNLATGNGGGIYAGVNAIISLKGNIYNSNPFLFPFIEAGNNQDPVTLANNSAIGDGGGIYADDNSQVIITDGFINFNTAGENGGAFYITDESELTIKQSTNSECWSTPDNCSIISNNKADTYGGGIYANLGSQIDLQKTKVFSNRASFGSYAYIRDEPTFATFKNNIIFNNGDNGIGYSDAFLIRGKNKANIAIYHSTIADNDMNNSRAIFGIADAGTIFSIYNSIVNNGTELVLENSSGTFYLTNCVLVNETSTLMGSGVVNLDPSFVDPANHNYHLKSDSEAIDFCATISSISDLDNDINGQIRPFDVPTFPNEFGATDAGADEFHPLPDAIFVDSFE